LKDSNTILVPSEMVYDVRLTVAAEGLPQGSTVGFEIFGQSTLGMTEFAQRVNYQRALEGELARTIMSL
jgi:flagellar M-ring protein FliF